MARLDPVFARTRAEGRAALVGYLPAGYPTVDGSAALLSAMIDAGCDIVEVGVPYSDPVMDGPTIQAAADRALKGGFRLRDLFRVVESVASAGGNAVVMTYWNPVHAYGVDRFARDLAAAGGLGLITPDLIPDEAADWLAASDEHGLDRIFLVAPSSTEERLALTAAATTGFLYATAVMGVTGARDKVGGRPPAWWRGPASTPGPADRRRSRRPVRRRRRPRSPGSRTRSWWARRSSRRRTRRRRCARSPPSWPTGCGGRSSLADPSVASPGPSPVTVTRVTVASSVFLANIPSPDRGVWELGPIPLRAYALCIIAGIIVAIWWGERRWVARGGTPGTVIDVAVFAVPFGLVGGRLYHVITDHAPLLR